MQKQNFIVVAGQSGATFTLFKVGGPVLMTYGRVNKIKQSSTTLICTNFCTFL